MAAPSSAEPMDVDQQQEEADKYIRLQQLISTGDVAAVRTALIEDPFVGHWDSETLWFEIFHSQRSPATVDLLRCLVEQGGVDPSVVDGDNMSALHLACSHCLKDCVEYLLGLEETCVNEADLFGMLPLHHAISMCKTQVALEGDMDGFLRSSADSLRASSDFSITQNDLPAAESVVSLLLDNGAQANLVDCTSSSRPPSYTTPLCFAVDIGNVRVVEALLKAGALVNPALGRGDGSCPKNCPPLQCALDNTDLVLAALLVQHGARCDARLKDGSYLIHHYCDNGNLPAVQFLISHDVTVNKVSGQRLQTPLQVAASKGFANIMELLLAKGAVIPEHSSSPLFNCTVHSGSVPAVKLLLDHGVSVNTQDSAGRTGLYLACNKSVEMVRLFLSSGANPNLGSQQYKPVCNLLHVPGSPLLDTVDILRELILYNADVDVCGKDYATQQPITLLHRALTFGESSVVDLLLRTGLVQVRGITESMMTSFRTKCQNSEVVQRLEYRRHNPWSLAQICRKEIRHKIHDVRHIHALPLPPPILDFILFTELKDD